MPHPIQPNRSVVAVTITAMLFSLLFGTWILANSYAAEMSPKNSESLDPDQSGVLENCCCGIGLLKLFGEATKWKRLSRRSVEWTPSFIAQSFQWHYQNQTLLFRSLISVELGLIIFSLILKRIERSTSAPPNLTRRPRVSPSH